MLIHDVETLINAVNDGFQPEYLFFWGHTPHTPNQPDQACLSQWFPAAFEIDGVLYPTAEHWMMAEKARLFDDQEALHAIVQAEHPAEAKKKGRSVRNFNEQRWRQQRFNIVVRGNRAKFQQHPRLAQFLLATQPCILVEASPVDQIWGVGLAANHTDACQPKRWNGLNLLGFALMQVRSTMLE